MCTGTLQSWFFFKKKDKHTRNQQYYIAKRIKNYQYLFITGIYLLPVPVFII
jgi:hypothetical protein